MRICHSHNTIHSVNNSLSLFQQQHFVIMSKSFTKKFSGKSCFCYRRYNHLQSFVCLIHGVNWNGWTISNVRSSFLSFIRFCMERSSTSIWTWRYVLSGQHCDINGLTVSSISVLCHLNVKLTERLNHFFIFCWYHRVLKNHLKQLNCSIVHMVLYPRVFYSMNGVTICWNDWTISSQFVWSSWTAPFFIWFCILKFCFGWTV